MSVICKTIRFIFQSGSFDFSMNFVKVKKMKRTIFSLLLVTLCGSFVFSSNGRNEIKDDLEDKIALSRDGGTTRLTNNRMSSSSLNLSKSVFSDVPEVEVRKINNLITISVTNFRGTASVVIEEIHGGKGSLNRFFEVYNDNAYDAFQLNGIPAGEYYITITLENEEYREVFTGEFRKGKNGHYK